MYYKLTRLFCHMSDICHLPDCLDCLQVFLIRFDQRNVQLGFLLNGAINHFHCQNQIDQQVCRLDLAWYPIIFIQAYNNEFWVLVKRQNYHSRKLPNMFAKSEIYLCCVNFLQLSVLKYVIFMIFVQCIQHTCIGLSVFNSYGLTDHFLDFGFRFCK